MIQKLAFTDYGMTALTGLLLLMLLNFVKSLATEDLYQLGEEEIVFLEEANEGVGKVVLDPPFPLLDNTYSDIFVS